MGTKGHKGHKGRKGLGCTESCRRRAARGLVAVLVLGACMVEAASTFQLGDHSVFIPERGQVVGCSLQTDNQRLTFVPPESWKATVQAKTKEVIFLSPDRSVTISMQLLEPGSAQSNAAQVDTWRAQVQERHPQGRLVEEFSCYIGERQANGFDMETIANGQSIRTRTCLASLPRVTVLFHLRAPSDVFAQHHWAFASMMGSLRLEQGTPTEP